MRRGLAAVLGSLILVLGCPHREVRFEQAALADFIDNHWGPQIFADECTGLSFDPQAPLLIFTSAPGYSVNLLDFGAVAPIDLRAAAEQEGGLRKLARRGVSERVSNLVEIENYPIARVAESDEPSDEWHPRDGYLLRFSNRVRFGKSVYVQIWVKGPRTSSGARVDYEFDESGRLVRSQKQTRRCDDWG